MSRRIGGDSSTWLWSRSGTENARIVLWLSIFSKAVDLTNLVHSFEPLRPKHFREGRSHEVGNTAPSGERYSIATLSLGLFGCWAECSARLTAKFVDRPNGSEQT